MHPGITKCLALKGIAAGIPIPEEPIDRGLELAHLKQLIELLAINCVLDEGANNGQFATELRGIGYKGLLVSFEPLQREFVRLQKAFSRDPLSRGLRVALGDRNGPATINVIPYLTVMSCILETRSVFTGAQGCLQSVQALQSETSIVPIYQKMPHYLESQCTYERAGFQLFNLSVVSREKGGCLRELNCFMKLSGR